MPPRTEQEQVRISCLALARIQDSEGRYVLTINAGRLRTGHGRRLSPVGGALHYTKVGRRFLEDIHYAHSFEGDSPTHRRPVGPDLRFCIPESREDGVWVWFRTRIRPHRESSVLRELQEELVEEVSILTPAQAASATERYALRTDMHGPAPRSSPATKTHCLIEVFSITLSDAAMVALQANADSANPSVYFVTPNQIQARRAGDGTQIGMLGAAVLYERRR